MVTLMPQREAFVWPDLKQVQGDSLMTLRAQREAFVWPHLKRVQGAVLCGVAGYKAELIDTLGRRPHHWLQTQWLPSDRSLALTRGRWHLRQPAV